MAGYTEGGPSRTVLPGGLSARMEMFHNPVTGGFQALEIWPM